MMFINPTKKKHFKLIYVIKLCIQYNLYKVQNDIVLLLIKYV